MKTARKALMLILCAALLVSATVMGTLAYLTDDDAVVNSFSVGNVTIELNEKDTDNDDYTADNVNVDGVTRDKANNYKLTPSQTIEKDPTVFVNTGSDNCYLFVKVENGIAAVETKETAKTIAAQLTANGWVNVADNVYIYTKDNAKATVSAGESKVVFTNFTVDGGADEAALAAAAQKNITVTAYAIQAAGFDDATPAQIWEALDAELKD